MKEDKFKQMTFEDTAINTERYGDCNEVSYELIFKDNIPKQRVKEAMVDEDPTHYPRHSEEGPHDYCERIKRIERGRIKEELGLDK